MVLVLMFTKLFSVVVHVCSFLFRYWYLQNDIAGKIGYSIKTSTKGKETSELILTT